MNVLWEKERLRTQLCELSSGSRLLFAACCAERLHHVAELLARSDAHWSTYLRVQEAVWGVLNGTAATDSDQLEALYEKAGDAMPEEDDFPAWTQRIVEYSLAASMSCLGLVTGEEPGGDVDAALAVWEATLAVDHEGRLVQSELARQRRDLAELAAAGEALNDELVRKFQSRARNERIQEIYASLKL